MADTKTKAPTYEADALYEVELARTVTHGRTRYTPAQRNRMKGRVLNELDPGDILGAEKL